MFGSTQYTLDGAGMMQRFFFNGTGFSMGRVKQVPARFDLNLRPHRLAGAGSNCMPKGLGIQGSGGAGSDDRCGCAANGAHSIAYRAPQCIAKCASSLPAAVVAP